MTNLTQRILTAIVAIPVILYVSFEGGVAFFLFVAFLSFMAIREWYGLVEAKGAKPLLFAGSVAGFAVNLAFFHSWLSATIVGAFASMGMVISFPSGDQLIVIAIVLGVVVLSLCELFRNAGSAVMNLASTVFGLVYVSLFMGTLIGIRELFTRVDLAVAHYFLLHTGVTDNAEIYRAGGYTVISLFAMVWMCDSAAFQIGRKIGKHKLFPRVSPNKSWEGAIAGFIFSVLAAVGAKILVLDYLSLADAVTIGAIVGAFGQLGDLTESLLKRDASVKDSSTLIPGHGGVLDRFDSLLLVAPLVYLYLDYIVF